MSFFQGSSSFSLTQATDLTTSTVLMTMGSTIDLRMVSTMAVLMMDLMTTDSSSAADQVIYMSFLSYDLRREQTVFRVAHRESH